MISVFSALNIFHNNFGKKTFCRWRLESYNRSGYYSQ